jgi:hypothetical protein
MTGSMSYAFPQEEGDKKNKSLGHLSLRVSCVQDVLLHLF